VNFNDFFKFNGLKVQTPYIYTMTLSRTFCLFLVVVTIFWSYRSLVPNNGKDGKVAATAFSVDRALEQVKAISQEPHGVGFSGHAKVRAHIIGELRAMGLETSVQEGYAASKRGSFSKAINILARIKGTEQGKALLLLTHYDSSPHSSFGASDAGSGVATILEGVRAFLAQGKKCKNDIIILISDAEELGLNGANLFVNRHPWAKEVGLVVNFEARGSGGPSYMLIETNGGNSRMVEQFAKANPEYPVTNSLAYSIYKMLPNDTDLTVFREDGDIEGFNLAFIDDHFDYHTALDNYGRLDRTSLAHQGSYLMPLLQYFGNADLSLTKSSEDHVYFNMPIFKLVFYPFAWIWPMLIAAVVFFVVLLIIGFRKGILKSKAVLLGCIPFFGALIGNGVAGYLSWPALQWWYPEFQDMLHGFTYNGHTYILNMSFFALAVCFWGYAWYKKVSVPNLLVAPIFTWLVICTLMALYIKGGSFFVIPTFGLLGALWVTIHQEKPSPYVLLFLALPALLIYAPFIKMFPVGLGLKMLTASTVMVTLLFVFIMPLTGQSSAKYRFVVASFALFIFFSVKAHLSSEFDTRNPKPSSLLYVYDADANTAHWATYDQVTIAWNSQFMGDKKTAITEDTDVLGGTYAPPFSYIATAPKKELLTPEVVVTRDTVVGPVRKLSVCITPRRAINRLQVFTNDIKVKSAMVNGVALDQDFLKKRKGNRLVTHYVSDNDYTEIELETTKDSTITFHVVEVSNDLLSHPQFSVPERPKNSIPMPFVPNDAIMTLKTIEFD